MKKLIPLKLEKDRYFPHNVTFQVQQHHLTQEYPLHWHEFYEIEFITAGSAVETINGIDYPVGSGFVVLLTPTNLHSYKSIDPKLGLTVYNLKFSPYLLPLNIQKMLSGISAPLFGTCPEMEPIVKQLLTEYEGQALEREQFILASITQICIMLFRSCERLQIIGNDPKSEMLLYIREHFLEPISVETLADVVHLTPNYFSEFFKKHMGIGFSAYVKKLRLEFAANLLLTSEITINETAIKSGFNNTSYFFNSFKAEYGMTPEQFRKAYLPGS